MLERMDRCILSLVNHLRLKCPRMDTGLDKSKARFFQPLVDFSLTLVRDMVRWFVDRELSKAER